MATTMLWGMLLMAFCFWMYSIAVSLIRDVWGPTSVPAGDTDEHEVVRGCVQVRPKRLPRHLLGRHRQV